MTFLNPLLLFGLFAAAIPIIIHLLNLRKLKTIEFSTLQFLQELQKTKMRRVKIKQWLLLALRTLLIIAVVMAFSRPALRGSLAGWGTVSAHARTSLIIVLDDSPSMTVRNERGMLFTRAQETARGILDLLKEGDEAYVLPLSQIKHTSTFLPSHDAGTLKKTVGERSPSFESVSYRDALGVAAKILTESKNVNQEIYLITDGQATQLRHQPGDTTDLFEDRVRLFVVDEGSGSAIELQNVGVTEATVLSTILSQNKPMALRTKVYNAGSSALRNAVLSVYLDGARVLQHSLDMPAFSGVSPTLSVVPKRRGILAGYVQLEDDALEADNKQWFVVNVPKSIAVLCAGPTQDDTRIVSLALTLDRDSASGGLFSVEAINEGQLSSRDLGRYDVVMLAGLKDFSTGEAERIAQFVNAGGGLILFPGSEMNIETYNSILLPRLGIAPLRSTIDAAGRTPAQRTSFLSFSKIEFEHPLFAGLFEQQGKKSTPSIESPRIMRNVAPHVGTRGNVIIQLSDGSAFLTEYQHGAGRVLLFAVEAGTAWSDFPLKGIFVPLLYRAGQYLAQITSASSFTVGQEAVLTARLKQRSDRDQFVLHTPSGIAERIVPRFGPSGEATFAVSSVSEPGVYELRRASAESKGELLQAFAVNIESEETDLRRASKTEFMQFLSLVGLQGNQVRHFAAGDNLETAITESRYGVELWRFFILLALACAGAEMIIGREAKHMRA